MILFSLPAHSIGVACALHHIFKIEIAEQEHCILFMSPRMSAFLFS